MQEAHEEIQVRARLRRARELADDSPSAIWLVDAIIEDALLHQASDIHIDPLPSTVRIRLRIDGELTNTYSLPRLFHEELVARCKILAGLRIDERTNGQDGRFSFSSQHQGAVDIRVSLLPCYFGQNVVLRLLYGDLHHASLATLGMSEEVSVVVSRYLEKTQGLILISGPTGSGKTTTLYALMHVLEHRPISLVSVEDPVEYAVERVRQVDVRPREGFGFGTALRSVLRQDPDVLMVGEIRDEETARLALQASLTGHLVLASIHGNSGTGTLVRLRDLGIEPYLLAEAFSLVITQHLKRVPCAVCAPLETSPISCACNGTRYQGRAGVFELLETNPELSRKIRTGRITTHEHA